MPMQFLLTRSLRLFAAAALCLGFAAMPAAAQFPERTVTIVTPFPPGNASDIIARLIGEQLSKRIGQNVIVDNKPGASGGIGAQAVARAKPDGHTLLMTSTSFTINTALTANLLYDPQREFDPVALATSSGGLLLMVPVDFPANNVVELVALLKKNPGKYNYGHAGRGTIQHLTMESFLAVTGTSAAAIGYKGSVQALTDMVGGQIDLMFDARGSATPFLQSGKLKAIAISSDVRSPAFANVPTVAESGLPGTAKWSVRGWVGMLAPAKTPKPVLDRLNREVTEILQSREFASRIAALNMEILPPSTPESVREFLRTDMQRWQASAKAANLQKE